MFLSWLDMDDDKMVTFEELYEIYETIVLDGQKGKFVCNGLEILDATKSKIETRLPLGVEGSACGWLVMPS